MAECYKGGADVADLVEMAKATKDAQEKKCRRGGVSQRRKLRRRGVGERLESQDAEGKPGGEHSVFGIWDFGS